VADAVALEVAVLVALTMLAVDVADFVGVADEVAELVAVGLVLAVAVMVIVAEDVAVELIVAFVEFCAFAAETRRPTSSAALMANILGSRLEAPAWRRVRGSGPVS